MTLWKRNMNTIIIQDKDMITGERLIKFLEACKDGRCLIQLHSLTIKTGLTHNNFFAAKLIDGYLRFNHIQIARKLFDETPNRTVSIWNRILNCYCRDQQYKESLLLFSHLFSNEKPDLYTIHIALKACAGLRALVTGKTIHGYVRKSDGTGKNLFVGSALIELYSKCGKMDEAMRVFEEYPEPDTVLWTTIVSGYEQNGQAIKALEVFAQMARAEGVKLDPITFVSAVSACAKLLNLRAGRSIHGYMIRLGLECSLSSSNALLNLYGKMGSLNAAVNLFAEMEEKDVVSWGCLLACYAHHGGSEEALCLFNEMVARGIEPNSVALISALQACEATYDLEEGKRIHKLALRKGLDLDMLVSTALIDMYMNCSSPEEAIEVFVRIPKKDAVCYSALMHGCLRNGKACKSIEILRDMLADDFQPNVFDLVGVLTACSELGALQQTSCIHGFAIRVGLGNNSFFGASVIVSYAKCGSLDGSAAVFRQIKDRDVVVWSSMLAALGFHGKGQEALQLFNQMIKHSLIRPNSVTFLSVLSVCSHAGLVKEGIKIFDMMVKDYQLRPNSKHYAIVVDLLGRIGELEKAFGFINQLSEPVEADIWGAFLGACCIYQNEEMGEIAAKKLLELDPCNPGSYVLLSNIYAASEKWGDVAEVRKLVKEKQLKKVSGQSVVEIRDEVSTFIANDRSHQQSKQIYELLVILQRIMKEEYNVLNVDIMLKDSDGDGIS